MAHGGFGRLLPYLLPCSVFRVPSPVTTEPVGSAGKSRRRIRWDTVGLIETHVNGPFREHIDMSFPASAPRALRGSGKFSRQAPRGPS